MTTRVLAFLALLAILVLTVMWPLIALFWLVLSIAICIPLGRLLAAINSAERRSARWAYPGSFLPRLAGGVICQEPSPAFPFKSVALSQAPQKRSGGRAGSLNASGLPAAFSHADAEGAGARHANDDPADGVSELALARPSARLRFGSGFGLSLHAEQSSGERKAWLATSQSKGRNK